MAAEGSPVSGGVKLLHTEKDGKHSYEVKGFLNHNKGVFTSKGDKLLMINNSNVEDFTPEALANILAEGSALLTIHHPSKRKSEECESEELSVNKKERTVMSFSLLMVRESELGKDVEQEPSESEWEDEIRDDYFDQDNLVIVSMEDTSFNLVVARGCDPDNPCNNCGKTNCQLNEVVVLPTKAEITTFPPKILDISKQRDSLFLKSFVEEKYVTPYNRQICLDNTMSAPITIYSYRANTADNPGVPVVLNFTGTENFLTCTTKQGEENKILTIVTYSKMDLKKICSEDTEKWSLVFYMTSGLTNEQRFESARYRGWFIYTKDVCNNDVEVDMHRDDSKSANTFFIIIES